MRLPLAKGTRKSNGDYRANLPVNMFLVDDGTESDDGYITTHPGLVEWGETAGTARGAHFNERFNKHFRVSGEFLQSVSADGTATEIGFVGGTSTCSFANSFNTEAVLSDGKLYLYDDATLVQVADPDLGVPIDITWFKGIYVMTDGEYLFHTNISNEYTIDPLKYSSSEFAADPIKGVLRTDSNQIIAFNRYSTEFFYFNANAATGTSVLTPIQGQSIQIGIVGTHCKTRIGNDIFIIGNRREESISIHRLGGGSIASKEVNKILDTYSEAEIASAYMEARTANGVSFMYVHLPRHTLLYNHTIATKYGPENAWSYLKSGDNEVWRGKFGILDPRINKWVYGDVQESKLAILDDDLFSQYDEQQEALFYTPFVPAESLSINSIELSTVPGFGSDDFRCAFSQSFDAVTWGQEHWNKIGVFGDYDKRYKAFRLGYVRHNVAFRFRFITKDRMSFSGMNVDAS